MENLRGLWTAEEGIILFGGSFNPPHKAHKRIARVLDRRFDKIFIIPCGPKYKDSTKIISAEHRMEMVKIAFSDLPEIRFDFYDLENDVYTPTYLLEERYKKLFPTAQIWHVIGEDIITDGHNKNSEIHRVWDRGNEIWNSLNFLVIVRPGYGAQNEDLPSKAKIMEIGEIIGSGTLIRRLAENNMPIDSFVDPDIEEYIKRNKLYQKK